jgi:hypothetical protein
MASAFVDLSLPVTFRTVTHTLFTEPHQRCVALDVLFLFQLFLEILMTIISRRIIVPQPGKTNAATAQAKVLCDQMNQSGTKTRLLKVIMGADVGNLEIYARYDNFTDGVHSFKSLAATPGVQAARNELDNGSMATMNGPSVYRIVFGEPTAQPILVQRQYQVSRTNLKAALALLPEAKSAFGESTGMAAAVPVFASEMDRLVINYYLNSLEDLGKALDEHAMSEAFQNVVAKAAQYGTLLTGRVLAVI